MTGADLRAQELDARTAEVLSSRLDEYFLAIEREGKDVQIGECDFLIESAADSLTRQFIALKAYEHYLKSPVMGSVMVMVAGIRTVESAFNSSSAPKLVISIWFSAYSAELKYKEPHGDTPITPISLGAIQPLAVKPT